MTHRTKQVVLLTLVVALLALLVLAGSLSNLRLQPGAPFPGSADDLSSSTTVTAPTPAASGSLPWLGAIIAAVLFALAIYLPARLIGLVSIRNILWTAAVVILLLVLFSILPRGLAGPPAVLPNDASVPQPPSSNAYPVSPLGKTPSQFIWIAAGGLLMAVSALSLYSWKRVSKAAQTKNALSGEAESALRDLEAGKDFGNVIVRCYLQMAELLRAERGMERQQSMTVREFEDWLASHDIPPAPVHDLTSLFEKARYSKEEIDDADEKRGAECLRQIVQHWQKGTSDR